MFCTEKVIELKDGNFQCHLTLVLPPLLDSAGLGASQNLLRHSWMFVCHQCLRPKVNSSCKWKLQCQGLHNKSQNYGFHKHRDTWLEAFVLPRSSCERVVLWLCWQRWAWGSVPTTTRRRWLWCRARSGDTTLLLGKVDNSSGFRGCHMRNLLWERCDSGWVEYQEAIGIVKQCSSELDLLLFCLNMLRLIDSWAT